jgi:rare lipoprotein A
MNTTPAFDYLNFPDLRPEDFFGTPILRNATHGPVPLRRRVNATVSPWTLPARPLAIQRIGRLETCGFMVGRAAIAITHRVSLSVVALLTLLGSGAPFISPVPSRAYAATGVVLVAGVALKASEEIVGVAHKAAGELEGVASWYDWDGRTTASGQIMSSSAETCAHKTLPLGSVIEVVNLTNGKSAKLTVNDRGPYIPGRVLDVTKGVAENLGFVEEGLTKVRVTVLSKPNPKRTPTG